MRILLPLLLMLLCLGGIEAQHVVVGRVIDAASQQAIEFATVLVVDEETGEGLGGTTTGLGGRFEVTTSSEAVYLKVSFIGFTTEEVRQLQFAAGRAAVGDILLEAQGQNLDEVTVRAERSTSEFRLDKRVFNVGKDLSSTGASALTVLDNVPSVNVTIEGQVQLRGSGGVQILVDGKPSVVASEQGNLLGTITADMIERVEVITNPSAKYNAEGTSGIINIVLKKDDRRGLNGAISLNGGEPANYSIGLSLNRRTEKFNLFSQLGVGYRELPEQRRSVNTDLATGTTIISEGKEFRNENYYNLVLGTDYHINERNVVTLSGNFVYEIEDQPSETIFESRDLHDTLASVWRREEDTQATNPKIQAEFQYKRDFADHEDHDLIFTAQSSLFQKDQSSEFINTTVEGADRDGRQRTRTDFGDQNNTIQLDYVRPVSSSTTLEAGGQFASNNVHNDYELSNFIINDYVPDAGLTNVFEWQQRVYAGYGTAGHELGKWGFKAGLRVEYTDVRTELKTTGQGNDRDYTNLFPSAHSSYKISDAVSVQAGYSRRIFRPRMWDLNPFFNPRDNFNIRTGNPDLLPEYSDSYEVTGIFILNKASLNASVFQRYTTDVVERIVTFEDNVSITRPANIGTNRATGLEINGKYTPVKKLTFTGDFNFNYFAREGMYEGISFDFSAQQWNTRLRTKLELPLEIDFEVTGRFQSSYQTVQGDIDEQAFADVGLRKKLLAGRGAVSLGVRDVLASRVRASSLKQLDSFQTNRSFRGRFITLGFSYGFGKGETMEYSGQRRRF